MLFLLIFCMEN